MGQMKNDLWGRILRMAKSTRTDWKFIESVAGLKLRLWLAKN